MIHLLKRLKFFNRKDSRSFKANRYYTYILNFSLRKHAKKYCMNQLDRMSLFKSFLLFCIAMILFFITAPFGFLYAVIRQTLAKSVNSLSLYFLELALALDNAGNVLMQHVLNDALLIKNENTYLFGNKMETISSVIGKNLLSHTLAPRVLP